MKSSRELQLAGAIMFKALWNKESFPILRKLGSLKGLSHWEEKHTTSEIPRNSPTNTMWSTALGYVVLTFHLDFPRLRPHLPDIRAFFNPSYWCSHHVRHISTSVTKNLYLQCFNLAQSSIDDSSSWSARGTLDVVRSYRCTVHMSVVSATPNGQRRYSCARLQSCIPVPGNGWPLREAIWNEVPLRAPFISAETQTQFPLRCTSSPSPSASPNSQCSSPHSFSSLSSWRQE